MRQSEKEVDAFMYIPDMTGFTEFMARTRPEESHRIVEEMLKVITDANRLALRISDIVGDAIFFFRTGNPPPLQAVVDQSKCISEKFKEQLKAHGSRYNWETNRVEQLYQLNIKFVAHYGRVAVSEIENHLKLIGVPAIEAHRLLKNSVQKPNYLLATESFLSRTIINGERYLLSAGSDSYDHLGEIKYRVLDLATVPVPVEPA